MLNFVYCLIFPFPFDDMDMYWLMVIGENTKRSPINMNIVGIFITVLLQK